MAPQLPLPHKNLNGWYTTTADPVEPDRQCREVYLKQGEIIVRIAYEQDETLRFEVQDSGQGIREEEQDKIFAMYYQVTDQHGGKPATGTGIGLAVSRRLAQAMGGDISVSSAPGQGSCFTVVIKAPRIAEEVEDEGVDDTLPLPALHVLLVEDIELNVIVARSVLENWDAALTLP